MDHVRHKHDLSKSSPGAGQFDLLLNMLDSSFSSVFAVDRDYCYLAFNQEHAERMLSLYGASIQTGHNLLEYVNVPGDRERLQADLDRALAGEQVRAEGPTGAPDLLKWYFKWRCVPLKDQQGALIGAIVSSEDISGLMEASQALTSSEELFRISFIHSTIGQALISSDGRFLRVNPALCNILGYSENELAHLTFNDVTYAEDKPLGSNFIKEALAGLKDAARFEKHYLRKDGQVIWADVSSTAFRDSAGQFQYLITSINEITGVKLAQAALQAHQAHLEELIFQRTEQLQSSEARYRSLFENMSSAILVVEPESGAILDANQEACRFYGYSHAELTGLKFIELTNLSLAEAFQIIQKVVSGELKTILMTHHLANGETRQVEVFPGHIHLEGWHTILVVIHDITERRNAELALLDKEAELRTLLDTIPGLIWSSYSGGNVDYLNLGWLTFTGMTQAQARGAGWMAALHPDDLAETQRKWDEATLNVSFFEVEQRLRSAAGEYHWFLTRAQPVFDAHGAPVKWYGINADITDHKQMEINIKLRMQELTCLYRVGRLLEDQSLQEGELCQRVLETLTPAMQFPELAAGLIDLEGRRYQTANYSGALTHELSASLNLHGRVCGFVAVYYSAARPFLLPEEQNLLDNIARMLGLWVERKYAEITVRKFTQAVEQSPASIVIADTGGSIEYINPHFTQLTGYSLQESLGKNPRILKSGHTSREEYERLWQTIMAGGIWYGEFLNYKKNGDQYWENATISPIRDEGGQITHFLAVKEDITARKQDQASMADALQFNQTILQTSPIGIMIYKASGECISANPAAALISGTKLENLLQQNFHTNQAWKQCELYGAALHTLKTGQPFPLQVHYINSFDKELWLNATFAAFTSGGEPHLMYMFEDNSDRQKAENLLELSNEKLGGLVRHLEQSKRHSDLLRQMGELLQICRQLDEAYSVIEQFGSQLFPGAAGAVFLKSPDSALLAVVAAWGGELISQSQFLQDDCWALRRGQMHIVNTGQPGLKCHHMAQTFAGSYLDIPMNIQGESLGLLHIECADSAGLGEETDDLAQSMAENLALSLSNIKLRQTLEYQSVRDPLTGAFNRRYMEETLHRELTRAARKKIALSIIMLDIDHFKKFNDTFGHAAGDLVLTYLSSLLQNQVRGEDVVCRLGGEEFVMILPDAGLEVGLQRAEAIRAAVNAQSLEYNAHALGMVTVSMGIAVYPEHGARGEEILEKADRAMYQAKHRGRNCVVVAE